jgi:hypothetical protein
MIPCLLLARARLGDAALPSDRQGVVEQSDLLRRLRCDRLYSEIFRSRRRRRDPGVRGPRAAVDRLAPASRS